MGTLNVIWLGGGCGAGKTTIATALARRLDLRLYRVDIHDYPHLDRMDAQRHPENIRLSQLDYVARHVAPPPEELAADFLACSRERFSLIVEDLTELSRDVTVLAEGPGLLPELVAPLIETPESALWLLPTSRFTDVNLGTRAQALPPTDSTAHQKRVDRDALLTQAIRDEAGTALPTLDVDGSLTIEQTIDRVAEHFRQAIEASRPAGSDATRSAIRRHENQETTVAIRSHLRHLGDSAPAEPVIDYACECGRSGCQSVARLPPSQYERLDQINAHRM